MKQLLKSLGFSNVKQSVSGGDYYKNPTYRSQSGKMVFGIHGGSIGPLTCTNAHLERNSSVEKQIVNLLRAAGATVWDDTGAYLTVEFGGKSVNLQWITIPTYTNLRDYSSYVLAVN